MCANFASDYGIFSTTTSINLRVLSSPKLSSISPPDELCAVLYWPSQHVEVVSSLRWTCQFPWGVTRLVTTRTCQTHISLSGVTSVRCPFNEIKSNRSISFSRKTGYNAVQSSLLAVLHDERATLPTALTSRLSGCFSDISAHCFTLLDACRKHSILLLYFVFSPDL